MSLEDFYFRDTCRMCLSRDLERILELTPTPPGNDFVTKAELNITQACYPLELYFCKNCHHVQLGHVVKPEILYQKDYSYVSSTSSHFLSHLRDYAKYIVDRFQLNKSDLVIDIGSNDGACLKFFKELGMTVQGVDPAANIADIAIAAGIPTIADFFSHSVAKNLLFEKGPAKIITSHNACAHIDNLDSVIKGVKTLLDDDGVFILEVGYFYDVFTNIWFDTIYHEHVDFHTVEPFIALFKRHGMEVISVERVSPQGGSIRVFVQKSPATIKHDDTVNELIKLEHDAGLNDVSQLLNYQKRIDQVRDDLRVLIDNIKQDNKLIAGFGAPTKATTLMAHFGIDGNDISFIVDDNPLKQNLFTPGTHIPVLSSEYIYKKKPDYLLILAWNFAEPIMKTHKKYLEEIGQFILPMPKPEIINSLN